MPSSDRSNFTALLDICWRGIGVKDALSKIYRFARNKISSINVVHIFHELLRSIYYPVLWIERGSDFRRGIFTVLPGEADE